VADLFSGQSLNPYSYVMNNPLAYVDPSGFQASAGLLSQPGDVVMPTDHIEASHTARVALYLTHQGPPPSEPGAPSEPDNSPSNAADFGAAAPAADVDTTGSSPEHDPQAMTTPPDEGLERSTIVRGGLGFAYGVGQAWLPGGFLVPSAQPRDFAFEFWRGAGQFTAGVVEVVVGAALVGGGGTAAGGGVAASLATVARASWSQRRAGRPRRPVGRLSAKGPRALSPASRQSLIRCRSRRGRARGRAARVRRGRHPTTLEEWALRSVKL